MFNMTRNIPTFSQLCILACSCFFFSSVVTFGTEEEKGNNGEELPYKKAHVASKSDHETLSKEPTKPLDSSQEIACDDKESPLIRVRALSYPLDCSIRKSPNRKVSLPTPSSKMVILIIEDDLVVQRVFQSYFLRIRQDSSNYELMFTETGEYGLFLYAVHAPLLTFIDGNLLGLISGDEVVTEIYRIERTIANLRKGKPVEEVDSLLTPPIKPSALVAFSNNEEQNDRMVQMGAHYKITKPLKLIPFQETLAIVLPPNEVPKE